MSGRGSGWLSRRVLRREISTRLHRLLGAHVRGARRARASAAYLVQWQHVSCKNHTNPQDGPRFTVCEGARSEKRLSDTECAPLHPDSASESGSEARGDRSRCCRSSRASMAAAFSSSHWSKRAVISLRRLAACERRDNSKLCRELREAERRNSQGGWVGRVVIEPPLKGVLHISMSVRQVKNTYAS